MSHGEFINSPIFPSQTIWYIRTQYIIVIYQHGVMVVIAYTVGKGMETAFGRQGISSNTSGDRSGTTPERVYRKQQGVSNRFSFPKVSVPNLTPDGSIRLIIKFILAHCGTTCRTWLLIRFIAHLGAC